MWMFLVLIYGLLKGAREAVKKKSLEKNTVPEVLFLYTLIGFIFVIPDLRNGFSIDKSLYFLIFIKALCVFLAWILSFNVIKHMPIGFYGILDMSRVLFAYILGIVVLREHITIYQIIGMPLVLIGLFLLKVIKGDNGETSTLSAKHVTLAVVSCLLNAISGLLDKIIMKNPSITSGELQFSYMLVLVILYGAYLIFTKTKIDFKNLKSNYWILILAIMFIVADRCLFIANKDPNSKITIMTLIKQSACFVTIILGKIVYKEKDLRKKLICASVVLAGIVIAVMGNKEDIKGDIANMSNIIVSNSVQDNKNSDADGLVNDQDDNNKQDNIVENANINAKSDSLIEESGDIGDDYINETLFIGDSNTVRMMNYGFTSLENTLAVTGMGIQSVKSLKCIEFEGTKSPVTIIEAIKIMQPRRIIMTYGTNNAGGMDTDSFIRKYKDVISAVKEAYPYADILINSVPPFHKINQYPSLKVEKINAYNEALMKMADELGLKYLDSASLLKNADGYAKDEYTVNDGIHISKAGFDEMFKYIRTHSYITEDRREKPLKAIPKQKGVVYVIDNDGVISHDPKAYGDMSDKDENGVKDANTNQNDINQNQATQNETIEDIGKEDNQPKETVQPNVQNESKHEHTPNEGVVEKKPTFTETGARIYRCTECGEEVYREEIPMLEEEEFEEEYWDGEENGEYQEENNPQQDEFLENLKNYWGQ